MAMNIFRSMEISGSGLTAQRYRMDIIGENIANATTTRTADGDGPYRRKVTVFQEGTQALRFSDYLGRARVTSGLGGVKVVGTMEDPSDFKMSYDPDHPDADEAGYVSLPNVDMEREMVDFIAASRAYDANITAINNFKNIAMKALEIGR